MAMRKLIVTIWLDPFGSDPDDTIEADDFTKLSSMHPGKQSFHAAR